MEYYKLQDQQWIQVNGIGEATHMLLEARDYHKLTDDADHLARIRRIANKHGMQDNYGYVLTASTVRYAWYGDKRVLLRETTLQTPYGVKYDDDFVARAVSNDFATKGGLKEYWGIDMVRICMYKDLPAELREANTIIEVRPRFKIKSHEDKGRQTKECWEAVIVHTQPIKTNK